MNVMYFKLRKEVEWHEVTGDEDSLHLVMKALFYQDDYVFKFRNLPSFNL